MEAEFNAIVDGVIYLHLVLRKRYLNHEPPEGERPSPFRVSVAASRIQEDAEAYPPWP